jgi:hypothetical protein
MTRIKSETIKTAHFEEEIIKAIKSIEQAERIDKNRVLSLLRALHNNCLEYDAVGLPTDRAMEIQEMLKEKGYKKNDEMEDKPKDDKE